MGRRWTIDQMYEHEGEQYGRLTVIYSTLGKLYGKTCSMAYCKCSCGNYTCKKLNAMRFGLIRSCGCLDMESKKSSATKAIKHGKSGTKTYKVWKSIRRRIYNPHEHNYDRYGGRGLTLSQEWNDYAVFLKDMGECPPGLTIDRIDNDKGYCKENCRWTTYGQQMRNTRRTHFVDVLGKKMCIADIVIMSGLPRATITNRLKKGWLIDDIILTPGGR